MRRSLILTLLLPMLLSTGTAPLRAGPWEKANAAFQAGTYAKALPLYEQVIAEHGPSAARLYNLANTYAKLDRPGPAVLAYERAALLAPRDPDIRANLDLIRPPRASVSAPWWQSPLYWLSLHEWSWITLAGAALLGTVILVRFLPKSPPAWWVPARTPLAGLGLLLTAAGSLTLWHRAAERHLAIITAAEPVLLRSPFPSADPVDTLPPAPGQRVIPGQHHAGWVHVTVPGSSASGWVSDQDIALIIPQS